MTDYALPRSRQALKIQLLTITVSTCALALLSLLLVRAFYRVTLGQRWYAGIFTFLVVMALGFISILLYQKKWGDVSYRLGAEAIIVNQADGFFSTTQEVYLYESILSASLSQGYFGKKYNYGDITLVIPKLDSSLRLSALANPEKQMKLLGSHLEHKVDRQTLVT